MPDLKAPIQEPIKEIQEPIAPEIKEESVVPEVKVPKKREKLEQRGDITKGQPCYWNIVTSEYGIIAKNTTIGAQFEGSMEEFNKLRRG